MTKARSLADFISDGNPLADGTIAVSEVSGAAPLADPSFTGNIAVTGNVDGRDVAADGTKLDGIETSATADQTDAEIRTAVEAATDSNVFTDADHSKLNAIEASATADQSDAEIRTAVEAATDSNVFTDADHTKLNAIEASADVTDTVNVVAALTAGSNITIASDGTIAGAAQYTHPTHDGDDAAIDTGALSGATVISDLDLNITTDTLGHVTDANATVATRNLTLANLGYTGATNANYITNNNQLTNGAGYTTSVGDITGVTAGSGISGGGTSGTVTVSHADTSSQGSVNNSGTTFIQDITLDTYGHITGLTSVAAAAGAQLLTSFNPSSPTTTFTSSGTWTKPTNLADSVWVIFYLVGGGEGGWRGSQGSNAKGGSAAFITGTIGELPSSASIVVGAGGAATFDNGTSGHIGGHTTITANNFTFTAKGGHSVNLYDPISSIVWPDLTNPFDLTIPTTANTVSGSLGQNPANSAGTNGFNSYYAGGSGASASWGQSGPTGQGGISTYAGNGGSLTSDTGAAYAGTAPGGGGGVVYQSRGQSPGAGAAGSVRIYYVT